MPIVLAVAATPRLQAKGYKRPLSQRLNALRRNSVVVTRYKKVIEPACRKKTHSTSSSLLLPNRYDHSYTAHMKTAISIPDRVFTQADRLAKRLGLTRSELYARAVERF